MPQDATLLSTIAKPSDNSTPGNKPRLGCARSRFLLWSLGRDALPFPFYVASSCSFDSSFRSLFHSHLFPVLLPYGSQKTAFSGKLFPITLTACRLQRPAIPRTRGRKCEQASSKPEAPRPSRNTSRPHTPLLRLSWLRIDIFSRRPELAVLPLPPLYPLPGPWRLLLEGPDCSNPLRPPLSVALFAVSSVPSGFDRA